MKNFLIIALVGSLFLISGCLNRSSTLKPESSGRGEVQAEKSKFTNVESGQSSTSIMSSLSGQNDGETQPSNKSDSTFSGSAVSPEEEKLIEDILNSIFEE